MDSYVQTAGSDREVKISKQNSYPIQARLAAVLVLKMRARDDNIA